jgi:hypothetical protein
MPLLLRIVLVLGGLAALGVLANLWGARRWRVESDALFGRLTRTEAPRAPGRVDFAELAGLPTPVERYLRLVLEDGAPLIASVQLAHEGTFNSKDDGEDWKPFTSTQRVVMQPRGFVWNATIRMAPGVSARVHDAYVDGEGILRASMAGLKDVMHLRDRDALARGELMRFVAESPWYPTALLPSEGVAWEAVDDRTARATITDGAHTVTLTFGFGDDGLIATVAATDRDRMIGGRTVPMAWGGRFWDYQRRAGQLIPTAGEVAWYPPEGGELPYWRARITAVSCTLVP